MGDACSQHAEKLVFEKWKSVLSEAAFFFFIFFNLFLINDFFLFVVSFGKFDSDRRYLISNYWRTGALYLSLYLSLFSLIFIKSLFFFIARETESSLEYGIVPLVKGKRARHRTLLLLILTFIHALNSPHLSAIKNLHTHFQNWGQNNCSLHKTVTGKHFITTTNPLEHYKMANLSK